MTRADLYALALARCHFAAHDVIKYALEASAQAPTNGQAAIAQSLAYRIACVLDAPDDAYSISEEARVALAAIQ